MTVKSGDKYCAAVFYMSDGSPAGVGSVTKPAKHGIVRAIPGYPGVIYIPAPGYVGPDRFEMATSREGDSAYVDVHVVP